MHQTRRLRLPQAMFQKGYQMRTYGEALLGRLNTSEIAISVRKGFVNCSL
jgi:hypothetical protein